MLNRVTSSYRQTNKASPKKPGLTTIPNKQVKRPTSSSSNALKTKIVKPQPLIQTPIMKPRQISNDETYKVRTNPDFVNDAETTISTNGITYPSECADDFSKPNIIVHQEADGFSVDLEANPIYGSTNTECEIVPPTTSYSSTVLQNLTPVQLWLIVALLTLLSIISIVLYYTGNSDDVKIIWGKLFCWLGLTSCSSSSATSQ